MSIWFSALYIIIFCGMLVFMTKVVKDMNLERFFKQGSVNSIRFFTVIFILICSSLVAWGLTSLSQHIYTIIIG